LPGKRYYKKHPEFEENATEDGKRASNPTTMFRENTLLPKLRFGKVVLEKAANAKKSGGIFAKRKLPMQRQAPREFHSALAPNGIFPTFSLEYCRYNEGFMKAKE
jgi:hypothetical protein